MRTFSLFGVVLLFGFVGAGTAMAQCPGTPSGSPSGSNNFCLTGVGNGNYLDGIYVSPYTATINGGVPVPVICDDFYNDVDINESWTVPVNGYTVAQAATNGLFGTSNSQSPLPSTPTYAQSLQGYEEVAWLSQQLIQDYQNPSLTAAQLQTDQNLLSYSIWAVFDAGTATTGVQGWLNSNPSGLLTYGAVSNEVTLAQNYVLNEVTTEGQSALLNQFSNVTIYTPQSGETCCSTPAQEFVTVHTAEAPAVATLGIDFLGLGVLFFVFRRQRAAVR